MVQQLSPSTIEDELLYPDSDGKPLADNTTQLRLIFTIKGGLDALFKDRDDVFVAADLLWYPVKLTQQEVIEQEEPQRQAPDVMVVLGRPKGDRGSYMQWKEDNTAPQVAFEILSPGNKKKDMETKFTFYQQHGIEEYYLYNPKKNRLQGWLRKGKNLKEITQMEGWKSPLLGVKFTTGEGDLVLFHPNGERFVDFVEVVEQRDRERVEKERERLEKERERVEKERERVEKERERLEKERQQQRAILAEDERDRQQSRADRAESDLQKMRERLLQLGIDPDSLS
ncbi:Uma2 family endonuclease [Spirulina sp. 06S082]|uniref:Uma2 family endonuclease n=1 Tax=Spirulina sp. 06S082 TaxID=3110248 RepID=UPI002B1EB88D|nr:Uma2 family endonuclease [Spirulina sp. 06S082]MEA5469119.1 Uma2 family endonuclease [Spirulina sp. 06S082]